MLRMIPIITICHRMTESIDEEEKLKLQIVVAGQRREVLMLTEEEKLVHQIYGAGQRREYIMLTEDGLYEAD